MELLVPLDCSPFSRQMLPYLHRLFPPDRFAVNLLHVVQPPSP